MKKGKDGIYNRYIKRFFDIVLSLIALIVLSPLFLILIITGAIAMKGSPFFFQKRPGMIDPKTGKEKIFSLLKFRTMTNEKDAGGNFLPDEKRLNKYGRLLRSTSLDELPQLINVFLGQLSLCGPRPLLVKYLPLYSEEQRHRHDVRPGITGYAQSHGRNGLSWEDRFAMDVWYAKNVSFRLDLRILADTAKTVLKRSGITSSASATMEEFAGTDNDTIVTWEAPV